MRATPSTIMCPICGVANPANAAVCAGCGQPLALQEDTLGDPMANTVGGAPVPRTPHDLRTGLQEAGDRLEPMLRDAAGVLSDRLGRHAAIHPAARRLQTRLDRISRRPPPYVPPPPVRVVSPRAILSLAAGVVLTFLWVIMAWLALISVAGRAAATRMLARAPSMLTLPWGALARPGWAASPLPAVAPYPPPMPFRSPMRVLYFLLIGWWASLLWLIASYLMVLTIVGIPLSYRMFGAAPTVAYLEA